MRGLLSSDTSEIEVGNMKRQQYNHREQERRLWNKWQNSDKRRLFNEQKQKPLQALMFWITHYPSILPILFLNLIPIFGVIFYDWEALGILGAYILETFVILFFSCYKIFFLKNSTCLEIMKHAPKKIINPEPNTLFCITNDMVPFPNVGRSRTEKLQNDYKLSEEKNAKFLYHIYRYKIHRVLFLSSLCFVWSLFFLVFIGPENWSALFSLSTLYAISLLFFYHFISFIANYFFKQENEKSSTFYKSQLDPIFRMMILHVVICLGALAAGGHTYDFPMLCILTCIKLCIDLYFHFSSHPSTIEERITKWDLYVK